MRHVEPEERTSRVLTWAFGVATLSLGIFGYFADRKTPLVLCILCTGLAFLSLTVHEVLTGHRWGWSGSFDYRNERIFFGFRVLSQFALSGILTIYALLILLGFVDFTLQEAKDFVRFWKRR